VSGQLTELDGPVKAVSEFCERPVAKDFYGSNGSTLPFGLMRMPSLPHEQQ
jgi:hypothetical protein